ncbi:MAG: hypothetical protein EXR71_10130 [Myxococcales bacterium]|nr:hypothetical protein [Myxococcales bacterium]
MLLPLVFCVLAGEASPAPAAAPAPAVVVAVEPAPAPCVVATVAPAAPPPPDVALTPAAPQSPVTLGDTSAKCVAAAVVPEEGRNKRSLKKTKNTGIEAESTDE